MGGRGSTRWREHTKAPLVEQTPSISIETLRRAPVFALDAALTGEFTVGEDGYGSLDISPETDGRREMQIRIRFRGSPEAIDEIDERLALTRSGDRGGRGLAEPKAGDHLRARASRFPFREIATSWWASR